MHIHILIYKRAQGNLPLPEPATPGHQPSEEHVDGLTASPFWDAAGDVANFPWAAKLEEKAHIIADEFTQQLIKMDEDNAKENTLFSGDSAWQSKVMGTGWSAFRLQRLGVWNVENCAKFPKTYSLLKELDIPLAVRGVCFARQTPGSGVAPHTDGRNFILTSHLGLKIPEGRIWLQSLRDHLLFYSTAISFYFSRIHSLNIFLIILQNAGSRWAVNNEAGRRES